MSLTESLIECVKTRPILYDLNHPEYKNVRKKENVWNDIGRELNQNGDDLKKKWKNIKDCYQKYLRTVNTKSGQVVKRSYKNWQWAQLMEFLRPQAESTINDIDNCKNETVHSLNEDSESLEENSLQDSTPCNRNSRKRVAREIPAAPSMDYLQSKKQQVTSSDATDLIFLGYSNTVKTFSPMRQAIVKMRIAQIIMEEELNNLEETTQATASSKSSPVPQETAAYDNQPCSSTTFSMKIEEPEPY
ncbi:uncharacterized protein LOC108904871 [Anoplophora glabripennis]|uniref:uncharacterized protein LOC108904871 n=1 Tax=Anoplophora glabripennis TaxID=217634 RepID=UPI000873792F|nr:uncharacterized protein LOC108904871 [Anoplophora glabripennis]